MTTDEAIERARRNIARLRDWAQGDLDRALQVGATETAARCRGLIMAYDNALGEIHYAIKESE